MDSLLRRHLSALRAFVQRHGIVRRNVRESLDDLLQSTCREVLQDLRTFDHHGEGEGAFAAWLCATAMRKIVDRHRFHTRQRRSVAREERGEGSDLEQLLRTSSTPSRDADLEQRRQLLLRSLASLPPHYQHVLQLAYFEGQSRDAMAQVLGKPSANAVQALLARALARLGNTMRRYEI